MEQQLAKVMKITILQIAIDRKGKLQTSFDYVHSIVETDWKVQLKVD